MNGGDGGAGAGLLAVVLVLGLLASAYLGRGALAAREQDEQEFTPEADRRSNGALFVLIACAAVGVALVLMGGAR